MTPAKIKIGYAPTRRSIFSAPAAIEYRNLTADRLRELGVDFVDITDINKDAAEYACMTAFVQRNQHTALQHIL